MHMPTFITGNQNKADYLAKMLGIELSHQKLVLDEIQSISLEEIVTHKVKQAYELTGMPVLVEDVSLGFDAQHGLPGPFIKFFVEQDDGLELLCRNLDGLANRGAVAACVFGYYDGERLELLRGELHGTIADHPRGTNGFGWDAIFCPDGYGGKTRAELTPDEDEATYATIKPFKALRELLLNLTRETT
jgi:inosine triphosphate pyrophosphatase